MTRKDFQLIADVLYDHKVKGIFTINDLVEAFAEKLKPTNPRFDEGIFNKRATKGR
jgi:hypothetical protein|tara:strand:+ start:313 stop:480 length:168 start_codon:yes stop_codon:yes gene_type:complete